MLNAFSIAFSSAALTTLGVLSNPAYAQGPLDALGESIQTIYTSLGGTVPAGVDLARGINALFYLVLPFVLILLILYSFFSTVNLFRIGWVNFAAAFIISLILIPTQVFATIIIWLYTAGGVAIALMFFIILVMGISQYIRIKVHEYGYMGVFASKSVTYTVLPLGWALVFGFAGFAIRGPLGALLSFFFGLLFGLVWAVIETRRSGAVAYIRKIDEMQKELELLSKEREKYETNLEKLLRQGRSENDPLVVSLRDQMTDIDRQIQSLQLEMTRARQKVRRKGIERVHRGGYPA